MQDAKDGITTLKSGPFLSRSGGEGSVAVSWEPLQLSGLKWMACMHFMLSRLLNFDILTIR